MGVGQTGVGEFFILKTEKNTASFPTLLVQPRTRLLTGIFVKTGCLQDLNARSTHSHKETT